MTNSIYNQKKDSIDDKDSEIDYEYTLEGALKLIYDDKMRRLKREENDKKY